MTFGDLLSALDHGARKLPNGAIATELVQMLEPFSEYCRSDGRGETLYLVQALQHSLVKDSLTDIQELFSQFQHHVTSTGIRDLVPTFKDLEIWLYYRNGQSSSICLLFSNCDKPILLAMGAMLESQFGFERSGGQIFVKDIGCDVTVICNQKDWACLKASGIPFNTCIVLDTDVPSDSMPDTFIRLPMCRDGYVKLCRSLIA